MPVPTVRTDHLTATYGEEFAWAPAAPGTPLRMAIHPADPGGVMLLVLNPPEGYEYLVDDAEVDLDAQGKLAVPLGVGVPLRLVGGGMQAHALTIRINGLEPSGARISIEELAA